MSARYCRPVSPGVAFSVHIKGSAYLQRLLSPAVARCRPDIVRAAIVAVFRHFQRISSAGVARRGDSRATLRQRRAERCKNTGSEGVFSGSAARLSPPDRGVPRAEGGGENPLRGFPSPLHSQPDRRQGVAR